MKYIDRFLNKITMYKLVLYSLLFLVGYASFLGFTGILPYSGLSILFSALFLKVVCWLINYVFSKSFNVPTNVESAHITALILALIITPITSIESMPFLFWVSVLAMASKYILALKNKHIFNPVAIALVITAFGLNESASWWVGTLWMMPAVAGCGILIVKKLRRWDLLLSFLVTAVITTSLFGLDKGGTTIETLEKNILYSPLIFFAFIMLTEPLTSPPTKRLRILYGALIGFLIPPQIHIGSIYSTPELALVIGNIFSYLVSPKQKLTFTLKEKIKIARNSYDFIFAQNHKFHFKPGQYMEWTLEHNNPDIRGNRRYFSIASSPNEKNIRLGVHFNENSSSFKKKLLSLDSGGKMLGGQLAGDFTLPDNPNKKLIFIAGGIGITPFRSIIQYLFDKNEKRDIVLLYTNTLESDIAYKELLDDAKKIGIKTSYSLTDEENVSDRWKGKIGYINEEMIKDTVSDYKESIYYISGPNTMVDAYKKLLLKMGVSRNHIQTDYFPGF